MQWVSGPDQGKVNGKRGEGKGDFRKERIKARGGPVPKKGKQKKKKKKVVINKTRPKRARF